MNNVEILGIAALVISSTVFLASCFWAIHYLEKDNKKNKIKKA